MLNIRMLIFIREAEGHLLGFFNIILTILWWKLIVMKIFNIFAMCLLIFSWLVIDIPFQVLNIFIIIKYTWYFMRSVSQCIIYITIWNNAFCQESLWCKSTMEEGTYILKSSIWIDPWFLDAGEAALILRKRQKGTWFVLCFFLIA